MSLLANEDGDQGITREKETITKSIGNQIVNSENENWMMMMMTLPQM